MDNTSEMTFFNDQFLSNISTELGFNLPVQSYTPLKNDSNTVKPDRVFIPCNNPENLIDKVTAERVLQVLYMGLLPLIELFGVTTNVINGLVFVQQGLKDRINLCLFILALADICFLLLIFSAKFSSFLGLYDEDLAEYWRSRHHETVLGPMFGAMNISNLMTTIISVERCICVVSPFTAKKYLKTRYMAIIIVIVAVYILGVYMLLNMEYTTVRVTDLATNTSHWVTRNTEFFLENKTILDILYIYLLMLGIPCLSLTVVTVATPITVIKLRQTLAWRKHQSVDIKVSAGDKRETAVTKMLTVVCFIYVTTITPSLTQAFIRILIPDYFPTGKYCNAFNVIQTLAHVCEVTNSSVNFIVYFTMGSRFRDTVRQLFGTWREKKRVHCTILAQCQPRPAKTREHSVTTS